MTGCLGGINSHNSASEWFSDGIFKTVGLDQVAHGGAAGEIFDGSAEVLIGFFLARNQRRNERHDSVQIKSVEGTPDRILRQRKIQNKQMSSGGKDALHFAQGSAPIAYVSQTERDGYNVEGLVCQRQLGGIARNKVTNSLATGEREHGIGKIQPHDLDSR